MSYVAHGGTPGLIAEILIGLTVGGLLAAIWIRERRRRGLKERGEQAQMRD